MNRTFDRRTVMAAAGASLVTVSGGARAQQAPGAGGLEAACAAYMDAWSREDLDGIARQIHPNVHFIGPMLDTQGRDVFLQASARIFAILERFVPRATFIAGDRAMFAYDFVCRPPIGLVRTGELVGFERGLIRRIELFYDARPFEAARRGAPA